MARRHQIHPLQSRSEIVLRNTVVAGLIAFFSIFYLIPILMAFVGSFHLWNPLKGQYRFTGLKNWQMVLNSSLFWQSMGKYGAVCSGCGGDAAGHRHGTGPGPLYQADSPSVAVPHFVLPAHDHPDGGCRFRMEIHV